MNNIYGSIFKSMASKKTSTNCRVELYKDQLSRTDCTSWAIFARPTPNSKSTHTKIDQDQNHYRTLPSVRSCITLQIGFNTKENLTVTIFYAIILVVSCTCNKTILLAYSPLNMIAQVVKSLCIL